MKGVMPPEAVRSHYEIAAILGISREAVWQAERKALAKLKAAILSDPQLCEEFNLRSDRETEP